MREFPWASSVLASNAVQGESAEGPRQMVNVEELAPRMQSCTEWLCRSKKHCTCNARWTVTAAQTLSICFAPPSLLPLKLIGSWRWTSLASLLNFCPARDLELCICWSGQHSFIFSAHEVEYYIKCFIVL